MGNGNIYVLEMDKLKSEKKHMNNCFYTNSNALQDKMGLKLCRKAKKGKLSED